MVTGIEERKFILIKEIIEKHNLKQMVSYLCKVAGVSQSGYYNYFSEISKNKRKEKEDSDKKVKVNILKAINFKKRSKGKGSRQIKMVLLNEFGINYNRKRISRVMRKYGLKCKVRGANPYKRIMKATQEHTVVPNILERNFKQNEPGKVLLTDITYLKYQGRTAYLSLILDSSTNEVLAHHVIDNLRMPLVTETLIKLKRNKRVKLSKNALINSDQGVHYTSPIFQKRVKKMNLKQSMSRRGNCWDNAPIESFFGHMKDEIDLESCRNLDDVIREIKSYITYHNNHRYQWNLKKMTPVMYRNHLLMAA